MLGLRVMSLTALGALAIFGARLIGQMQPPSDELAGLHLTDCALPCWLGITPGETSYEAAVQRISTAYPQVVPPAQATTDMHFNVETPFGQILLSADRRGVVHRMTIHTFNLRGVTLGSVVSLLGAPTWRVGRPPTVIYYGCETYLTVVAGRSADGGWQQPIAYIDIQDTGYSCPAS